MQLEAIVERDYFPEMTRLKDRLEWLEARNSGDPQRMSAALGNITKRRGYASTLPRGLGPCSVSSKLGGSVAGSYRQFLMLGFVHPHLQTTIRLGAPTYRGEA